MVAGVGDAAAGAGLHAMGGLMGQGVPHRLRIAVHAADHDRVAAVVIKTLQAALVAVLLQHLGAVGREQRPQVVDVRPAGWPTPGWGSGLGQAGRNRGREQQGS